jgi:hypothetical protein
MPRFKNRWCTEKQPQDDRQDPEQNQPDTTKRYRAQDDPGILDP